MDVDVLLGCVSGEDVSDEGEDGGFADTSLADEEDGELVLVFRRL